MDDLDKSQELLTKIGQMLVKAIPESWESAYIVVDFSEEETISSQSRYISSADNTEKSFNAMGINWQFAELRNIVKKNDQNLWKKVKFSIAKDGNFKTEFEY